ncbi:unnamed protein product [Kluyveromyces dobzhanskii CBS 2104]|uniref:Large ribosomal subunit protein uL29m n=1 Tax=Kluyveromyces dobzhanskii CBS 2104 TaxID=1427455 RepID=A0A0A8L211_9SACH|nr:unnamed protein product [Kluyveromyces dobzhanskii CBS 2104]
MFPANRGLHTSAKALARTRFTKPKPKPPKRENVRLPTQRTHHNNDLKITAPIPPAAANLSCPDDHPLWQFFSEKKFLRTPEELDSLSRSWTIPELRRKSFNDLHSLWYTCLKERNVLARENHLVLFNFQAQTEAYENVSENIRTTMWRIRHVLSERDWAFRIASENFAKEKEAFISSFEKDFLEAPINEDEEMFESLQRFQYAVYGISEYIDENKVDRAFVDGLKAVATLKLRKFALRNENIKTFLEESNDAIVDAGESFLLYTSENTESAVLEATNAVRELRESGSSVSRYDELETVQEYMNKLAEAQMAKVSEAEIQLKEETAKNDANLL